MNSDLLPGFLRARLAGRDTLRRAFDNSFWLFSDQILRMAAGLLVGIWMARYLGPTDFGWLNYALATVSVVGSLASLGINAVVVRELARSDQETAAWMGTAFFLRAAGAAIGFLACVAIAWRQPGGGEAGGNLLIVVAAGLLFQVPDVVDLMLQARGEARVAAWVRMAACVGSNLFKVGLIILQAPLIWFAVAGVLELALAAIGWIWTAGRGGTKIREWRLEQARVWALLQESWPLAVSGLAVSAQAYADQMLIGALRSSEELGQYSAALRLVSVFAFIPMVVQTVAAPEITRAKRDDETLYQRRLHSLYRLMFGLFFVTGLPLVLFGPAAARWLYGAAYSGAATLLPWLAFRLFFTSFGVARGIFITNNRLFRFALVTAIVGAVVNIALNLILIPQWGAKGAIVSSLISFGITTFGLEVFDRDARQNLKWMARAVFQPWRRFGA